ncbi:G2/mitotic-specific cyclin C13-1-like [Argentina anserina]|uniref:G2/mitotic-specific cyclin C13-1-like n=1 Tax=Argentina anserina TaxID=57926 RepID=UPI002176259B|nr:G2/mitotic-specific cyclin C13-1-like [Potentilla anserina]
MSSFTMAENRAAAKRRAVAALAEEHQLATKKRAVLGDLTNLADAVVLASENPKPKCEKRSAVSAVPESDNEDPQLCGAYASDIYAYLRRLEVEPKRRPLPDYMERIQRDAISATMRGILVDWLVDVADEFKFLPDTLYLCVSYVDKYLSMNVIDKQKLQLLGVASMFIASKYEEINPPNADELSDMTENTYTKMEVIKMEADILKSLKFEMGNPTVRTFLRKFTDAAHGTDKTPNLQFEFLVSYLGELSLLDYKCVKFLPSLVASSVIFLARLMRSNVNPWCSTLQQCTGYKAADLKDCVLVLHDLYLGREGGSLQVVREKYKQHKFKFVANVPCPPELPAPLFDNVNA